MRSALEEVVGDYEVTKFLSVLGYSLHGKFENRLTCINGSLYYFPPKIEQLKDSFEIEDLKRTFQLFNFRREYFSPRDQPFSRSRLLLPFDLGRTPSPKQLHLLP